MHKLLDFNEILALYMWGSECARARGRVTHTHTLTHTHC